MNHHIVPEEEQIDIEYSIEERIEENISKLEPTRKSPILNKKITDCLKVNTVVDDDPKGYVELNFQNDSDDAQDTPS